MTQKPKKGVLLCEELRQGVAEAGRMAVICRVIRLDFVPLIAILRHLNRATGSALVSCQDQRPAKADRRVVGNQENTEKTVAPA